MKIHAHWRWLAIPILLLMGGCYSYEDVSIVATDSVTRQPVANAKVTLDDPNPALPWLPRLPGASGKTDARGEVKIHCIALPSRLRAWAEGYRTLKLDPFLSPPDSEGRCHIELSPKHPTTMEWAGVTEESVGTAAAFKH